MRYNQTMLAVLIVVINTILTVYVVLLNLNAQTKMPEKQNQENTRHQAWLKLDAKLQKECVNILTNGHWYEPKDDLEQTYSNHLNGDKTMQWVTSDRSHCRLHDYTWMEALQCFKTVNSKSYNNNTESALIEIYGDSRARQVYSSMIAILAGSETVYDNADNWRNFYKDWSANRTIFNFKISQYYAMDMVGKSRIQKAVKNNHASWLNLIPAMTLHPLVMSGKEQNPEKYELLKNGSVQLAGIMNTLDYLENTMIPDLLELDTTTIFMDSEPIWPEKFSLDGKRNELIEVYHEGVGRLIPEEGLQGKIFRMSVNVKTVVAKNGIYMLPDGKHLIKKDTEVEHPPPMKANLNLILNFMCNDVVKPLDSTCCRTGYEV